MTRGHLSALSGQFSGQTDTDTHPFRGVRCPPGGPLKAGQGLAPALAGSRSGRGWPGERITPRFVDSAEDAIRACGRPFLSVEEPITTRHAAIR